MKTLEYIKPEIVVTSVVEAFSILEASGKLPTEEWDAKESTFEEEEAPVYQNNSIWADEEKED